MCNQDIWQKIKDKPYCDPTKRMDFVLFYDVRDGNPNGDPDAGNLPRMDPETGQGIVTDVCIKRKIRDYLMEVLNRKIFIQSSDALNSLYFKAADKIVKSDSKEDKAAVEKLFRVLRAEDNEEFKKLIDSSAEPDDQQTDKSDAEQKTPFRDWLASVDIEGLYFDQECEELSYLGEAKAKKDFKELLKVEGNGHEDYEQEIESLSAMLGKLKKGKGGANERPARDAIKKKMCKLYDDIRLFGAVLTAGTNAGQIRGPLQLTFGRSIERILQFDAAITRCAITKSSDWKKKQTEFGRKPWLNWAVYRQHGFYNPLLGQQTGVTREDLARFWEALACMFRNADSASKGEMTMHDIIVFVHNHPHGDAPTHKLFEKIHCEACKGHPNPDSEKSDRTLIKRDGFEKYYSITIDNPKIDPARPLNDIWG